MGRPEDIIKSLEGKPEGELEIDVVGWWTSKDNTRKLRQRVRERLSQGKDLVIKNGRWIILALVISVLLYANSPMIGHMALVLAVAL